MPMLMIGPMLDHAMTHVVGKGDTWSLMTKMLAQQGTFELENMLASCRGAVTHMLMVMPSQWGQANPSYLLLGHVGQTIILEHGRAAAEGVHHHVHVGMLPETSLQSLRDAPLDTVLTPGPITREFWPASTKIERAGKLFQHLIFADHLHPANLQNDPEFNSARGEGHWLMFDVTEKSRRIYETLR